MEGKRAALKGINDKTVVHCETQELATKACKIAEKKGWTWVNGRPYSSGDKWSIRGAKTCYNFTEGMAHSIDAFRNEGYTIISATEFIRKNSQPKTPNVPLTPEQLQFNLDRLASETDNVIKTQVREAQVELKSDADEVAGKVISELKEKVIVVRDAVVEEFVKKANETMVNNKEMLLEELRKGRTTINVGSGAIAATYSISTDDHYMMESVFKSLLLHKKAMLAGEAGTGKTYMAAQMASKLGLGFYKYSASRDSSVHDLIGYKQPRSEEYLMTTFLTCYENGGVFLVDEYDAMPGDVALFFNGVADSSKSISIPHRDSNPIANKHKDFYLIMCGNTWGKGSQDYSGRDFQDMALLDRFRLCRHHIGYDKNLEISMVSEKMYPFITALRATLTELGSYLSTRNVEDIALLMRNGENLQSILKTMAADLEEGDRQSFERKNLAQTYKTQFDSFMFDVKVAHEKAEKESKKTKVVA